MLHILATSRVPLGVAGEIRWQVPPLAMRNPEALGGIEAVSQLEAVQLFVERARGVSATFELTEQNASAVADICVRLEGIPLAIELAAARSPLLSPAELARRLAEPLRVLTRSFGNAPARQQTLRATLDWSYGLLAEAEQALLARLSIFSGGWSLAAAEVICADGGTAPDEMLDLLGELVAKSLVVVDDTADTRRYRLLEPVRQYAAERLEQRGEAAHLRDRHQGWCLALVNEAASEWFGPDQVRWLARLEQEHDNLRAALTWSCSDSDDIRKGLELGTGMSRFWDLHGYLSEGCNYLRTLVALDDSQEPSVARAAALINLGYLLVIDGAYAEARSSLEEGRRLFEELEGRSGLAAALFHLALLTTHQASNRDDIQQAEALLTTSLRLAREHGPDWAVYLSLLMLGNLGRMSGDVGRAEDLMRECRSLTERFGDRWSQTLCLHSLALVRLMRGDHDESGSLLRESLALSLALQDRRGASYAVDGLACVEVAEGRWTAAAQLFEVADTLRESMGQIRSRLFDPDRERAIARARAVLGDEAYEAARLEEGGLTLKHALAKAAALVGGVERSLEPPSAAICTTAASRATSPWLRHLRTRS